MRRGILASLIATAMLAAVVATGCGGGSSGSEPAKGGKTKIVLWHMEQPPNRVKRFQEVIDRFNASHPGVEVQQQVQDWNQIYSKIAAAAQSQTQPDILFTIPDFTTYVKETGLVQPVTGLVKELDAKHGFLPAATAPYQQDGQYLAVPLYGMVQMLWYRKDLFAKAGLKSAPATWSELLADARKLTTGKQHGIALPAGKNLATDQVVYSLMITAKAQHLYAGPGNEIAFDNPNTVRAFELYDQLLDSSPADSTSYSWGEPQAAFNNGSAAMAIEKGQYLAPFTKESGRPAKDLGCAPIPQPDTNGQPGSIYYSNAAMITTTDAAKQKAAGEFLSYLLEPKVYGRFLNAEPGLFLPLTADGAKSASWTSDPVISKYRGCVNRMLEQSKSGALFGFTNGYHESIGKISGQNILAQVIQKMHAGMSPAEAVKWGQEQMQKAVA